MKRAGGMSAAFAVFVLVPLLTVSTTRAEAAVDIAADVHLSFRAGEADVGVFYDALAPYGDWVDTDRYGLCWAPRGVEHDWRPYHYGHWVYTDYEWTWVGDEEWAWGPYHYGRWALDPAYGWVWVPGTVWAPAWVAWRWGDGYAGWAPLPPEADPSAGPADFGIDPLAFVFVEERYLAEPVIATHYVPPARNVTIINITKNVTNYRVVDSRVVNHGVPVDAVERTAGHAVQRVRLTEHTTPSPTHVRGNEVAMFRPAVPRAAATPSRPRAATRRPELPPSATADPRELQRRQDDERQRLQASAAKERDELHRLHEQEKARPPANVSPQQLEERHRAEERAQAQNEQRQKQLLEERHTRERKAAEEAAKQRQEQQKDKKKQE